LGLSKYDVAKRWAEGRAGHDRFARSGYSGYDTSNTYRISTDGQSLFSYKKQIGFTDEVGRKIAIDFRDVSRTTTAHIGAASDVADQVWDQSRDGGIPRVKKDADALGRLVDRLGLSSNMRSALPRVAAGLAVHGGIIRALERRGLAVREPLRVRLSIIGSLITRYFSGEESEECAGCIGWEDGIECPLHPAATELETFYPYALDAYRTYIRSLKEEPCREKTTESEKP
jgi:predicted Rdx family selenoprotein